METSESNYSPAEPLSQDTDAEVASKSISRPVTAEKSKKRPRSGTGSESLFHYSNGNKKPRIASYSNEYRELFNEVVEEYNDPVLADESSPRFFSTQLGSTRWSTSEKEIFFAYLDRKGRDDIKAIAEAIGTKSELEVESFIQILERGVTELYQYADIEDLYGPVDMPAACEISALGEEMLEDAADGLAARQLTFEEKVQERKYGSLWNLNNGVSATLKEQDLDLTTLLPAFADVNPVSKALGFLNLDGFLETSSNVFMNSNEPENNFHSFAAPDRTPSITLTAFLDLYNIAEMITRRIVAASHFYALGRVRALPNHRKRSVRIRDVRTALGNLQMCPSSHDFWVGAARRCKISVYEEFEQNPRSSRLPKPSQWLNYDQVEMRLEERERPIGRRESLSLAAGEDTNGPAPQFSPSGSSATTDLSSPEEGYDDSYETDLTDSNVDQSTMEEAASGSREQDQDVYMNILDRQASHAHELELWTEMGYEPPTDLKDQKISLPVKPPNLRKYNEELINWRSWLVYQSEWERDEQPVPDAKFEEDRKLMEESRRRRAAATKLSEPDNLDCCAQNQAVRSSSFSSSSPVNQRLKDLAMHDSDGEADLSDLEYADSSSGSDMEAGAMSTDSKTSGAIAEAE